MFDCSLYPADGIREAADVRHEIIEYQIAEISPARLQAGHRVYFSRWLRHAGLVLFRCAPRGCERNCSENLSFTEDIERAERELRLRERPN